MRDMLKPFETLAMVLMMIGALNWGVIGLFETNLVAEVFGAGSFTDAVYVVIGVAALIYVPRLMDALHIGTGAHPRGAH